MVGRGLPSFISTMLRTTAVQSPALSPCKSLDRKKPLSVSESLFTRGKRRPPSFSQRSMPRRSSGSANFACGLRIGLFGIPTLQDYTSAFRISREARCLVCRHNSNRCRNKLFLSHRMALKQCDVSASNRHGHVQFVHGTSQAKEEACREQGEQRKTNNSVFEHQAH